MKIMIETSIGLFLAYLTPRGEIAIYEGEDDIPVTSITPNLKRTAVLDVSTDGVANAARSWLEHTYNRLEVTCVIAQMVPPSR